MLLVTEMIVLGKGGLQGALEKKQMEFIFFSHVLGHMEMMEYGRDSH